MQIHGWGRYPSIQANLYEPDGSYPLGQLLAYLDPPVIARGAGKSYGDSALNADIISSRYLDNFISFDTDSGVISAQAGLTLEQILDITIPKGWFLPVVPGTKFVSLGGAIASDVHGKNHHVDGSFSEFVTNLTLMLASGEVVQCSASHNAEIFAATCGGMGLTGIILDATVRLQPISTTLIEQTAISSKSLAETFELFESHHHHKYSVAWLDCIATGSQLGRSILFLSEHKKAQRSDPGTSLDLVHDKPFKLSVPVTSPAFLLNKTTMRLFNNSYYRLAGRKTKQQDIAYESCFFPLDRILNWNKLYGSKGFLQYQFVIPYAAGFSGITEVLREVTATGKGSFLCVLKKFGKGNANYLSFPIEGYTLTLDFKYQDSLFPLLDKLDAIVLHHGGRLYCAKDARMNEQTFKKSYCRWEEFAEVKERLDPQHRFSSLQSTRLGL